MLSDQRIEEFRKIYFEQFGEEISREEAYEQGMKLLGLIRAIYRPLPKSIPKT